MKLLFAVAKCKLCIVSQHLVGGAEIYIEGPLCLTVVITLFIIFRFSRFAQRCDVLIRILPHQEIVDLPLVDFKLQRYHLIRTNPWTCDEITLISCSCRCKRSFDMNLTSITYINVKRRPGRRHLLEIRINKKW
jgi:hypothetical protein